MNSFDLWRHVVGGLMNDISPLKRFKMRFQFTQKDFFQLNTFFILRKLK